MSEMNSSILMRKRARHGQYEKFMDKNGNVWVKTINPITQKPCYIDITNNKVHNINDVNKFSEFPVLEKLPEFKDTPGFSELMEKSIPLTVELIESLTH